MRTCVSLLCNVLFGLFLWFTTYLLLFFTMIKMLFVLLLWLFHFVLSFERTHFYFDSVFTSTPISILVYRSVLFGRKFGCAKLSLSCKNVTIDCRRIIKIILNQNVIVDFWFSSFFLLFLIWLFSIFFISKTRSDV